MFNNFFFRQSVPFMR